MIRESETGYNRTEDNYAGDEDMEVRRQNKTKGETCEGDEKRHSKRFSDYVAGSLRELIKLTKKRERFTICQ